jgi:hypothetical protein
VFLASSGVKTHRRGDIVGKHEHRERTEELEVECRCQYPMRGVERCLKTHFTEV